MSKTITSTIECWPGTVTLKTTVNYADIIAWDDAADDANQYLGDPIKDQPNTFAVTDINRYRLARLPGLLHFVESHTLKGLSQPLTVDNFPALPRLESAMLFVWLRDEVSRIIAGENDDEKKDGA